MRCAEIKIHVEIPIPINSNGTNRHFEMPCFKDKNDVVYELSAIKDACENVESVPIIRYDDNGNPIVIGTANSVKWNPEGFIEIDGVLNFGSTSEEIIFSSSKDVTSMEIEAIGLGT